MITSLVTGAAGSIGSEIVRQERARGSRVICLDSNEYGLYLLEREHTGRPLLTSPEYVLADVRDQGSLDDVVAETEPDIVFHAAALKQLPLMERNPSLSARVNVGGTYIVASTAVRHGVARFVNISTDKAASPVSVLGLTKRIAEKAVRGLSCHGTAMASVRFGNVYASRGSFVETLRWQLANWKSVTLTHPDMTRYFISIPDAVSLAASAGELARRGEIFMLDMGQAVKILDVIRDVAAEMEIYDPKIVITGVRSGEKLSEHLCADTERQRPTGLRGVYIINEGDTISDDDVARLLRIADNDTPDEIHDALKKMGTS